MISPEAFLATTRLFSETALLLTREGVILAVSRSGQALGVDGEAWVGKRLVELTPTAAEQLEQFLRACARSRAPVLGTLVLPNQEGEAVRYRAEGALLHHDPEGAQTRLILKLLPRNTVPQQFAALNQKVAELSDEIRRRRVLQKELWHQSESLRVTLASIGDGVIVTDSLGRVTFLNQVAEELTGWPLEDALDQPLEIVFQIVNETTRVVAANPAHRALREGRIVGLANHTILIARDGRERAIDDSAAPIQDPDGEGLSGAILVFRDVSETRRLETERRRLAALVESSEDAVIGQTIEGQISYWNAGAEQLFGYTQEEAVGQWMVDLIVPPSRHDEFASTLERVKRGQRVDHFETIRVTKQGHEVPVSIRVSPIRDADGQIIGISAVDRDITHQRMAEQRRSVRLAVTQILAQEDDAERATRRMVEAVGTTLGWDLACSWQPQPDGRALKCQYVWGSPALSIEPFERATREADLPPGVELPGRAWQSKRPEWVTDIAVGSRQPRALAAQQVGLHAAVAWPAMAGDEVLAVVEFLTRQQQQPDEELLELFATIGAQYGQFLERVEAVQRLRQGEERLRLTLHAGQMGSWEWNILSGQVRWSTDLELIHGIPPGSFPGTFEGYQRDIHPDDRESVLRSIQQTLESGREHHLEYRIVWPDGSLHWLEARGRLFYDGGGTPVRMMGVCTDITERKRVEHDLQLQARVLESMTEGVSLSNEQGIILYTNPAEDRIFGYEPGELIGQHVRVQNDYPPEENERRVAEVIEHLRKQEVWDGEFRNRKKDGTPFFTHARITALEMEGQPYWVCVQEDVTERRLAEAQLRESELRFRQLAENIDNVFWISDLRNPRVLYVSPAYSTIWGRPAETLYNDPMSFLDVVHVEDRPRVLAAMEQQRRGETTNTEYRIIRPDGAVRWIWDRGFPISDGSATVDRVCGIAEDVTERKRGEATLQFLADASESLAALVDYKSTLQKVARLAVPEFADWCAVDMAVEEGKIKRVAVAHVDPEKIELAHRLNRKYPPDPASPHGVHQVLRSGKPAIMSEIPEEAIVAAARDEEHLEIFRQIGLRSYMAVPLHAHGRVLGVLTFVSAESGRRYTPHDLSIAEDLAHRVTIAIENAQLYQELREAAHRKDEFLAMLAHELRNPLAPIRSGLDILSLDAVSSKETVNLMREQVEHLVRLVDDLLDVSRITRGRVDLRRQPVELATVVRQSVEAVRGSVEAQQQQLSVHLPEQPVWLVADPVRVVQIVENLLNNASKYTDEKGRIELRAELHDGQVVLRVRDTGIGIEPELLPKVFDLFTQASRSLDRAKGGLGIGLTLVRNLVEMHGGAIAAYSEGPGKGSEFVVTLPTGEAPGEVEPPPETEAQSQPRRVLVVDDNHGAARMLSLLLSRLGRHEVEVAHDGRSALEKIEQFRPDVVLLDIGLPGIDGHQVARMVRAAPHYHDLFLVALTGYGQAEDRRRSKESGFDEHLVKPVAVDDLQRLFSSERLQRRPPAAPLAQRGTLASEAPAQPAMQRGDGAMSAEAGEFFRELVHEVGNAILPVQLVAQLLRRDHSDAAVVEQVREMLEQQIPSLNRLMDELRRVGRAIRGGEPPRPEQVELMPIVERAVEAVQPQMEQRGQKLAVDVPSVQLIADPDLVGRALAQLFENASYYTPAGGQIELLGQVDGQELSLVVRDSGAGIASELLPQIFDLFIRGEGEFDFTGGRLGVGLAMVRQVVTQHGGTVVARSEGPGQGSEFIVRLPIAS